ncbi:MAG TPA: hypothetical protein DIW17_15235 [Clostridiales bacterium]|nr:hypothetical protein [Clostridiales bacterium]
MIEISGTSNTLEDIMFKELFESFFLVLIAEMGDKSQLLAMTFAARYPVRKVLLGILIGAVLNDGLAVLLGSMVSAFLPMDTIQIIAGFAFIIFALWTLRSKADEEEDGKHKLKLGPVLTVALAYFLGEFGDKTQLTAITLASQAVYPAAILAGTVMGMFSTGALGIYIGSKLGDKIPETAVRLVSSGVFLFFGITKLHQSLPKEYLTLPYTLFFTIVLFSAIFYLTNILLKARKSGQESALIRRSRELHEYFRRMEEDFDSICLGSEKCGHCQGRRCIVGYTKILIMYGLDEKSANHLARAQVRSNTINKPFSKQQAMESLILTLKTLKEHSSAEDLEPIHEIRRNLELILFGKSIEKISDWNEYEDRLFQINKSIAAALLRDV